MGPGGVDWFSAVAVLAAGIGGGSWLVRRMRVTGTAAAVAPEIPMKQRDLLGKRDALLRQLAELEDTAGERDPALLARERYTLELEAAGVLMEIDRIPAPATEPSERLSPPGPAASLLPVSASGTSALRAFLWGVGAMAAFAGLVLLVTQSARPRRAGGPPAEGVPAATTRGPGSQETTMLRDLLQGSPEDLGARLALARELLEQGDMMGVWNETQYVLARSPGNPQALSYQAVVRLAMGQPEIAQQMLEQAISAAPDMLEAYGSLAVAQARLGRGDAAARTIAMAKQRFPGESEALVRLEAQLGTPPGDEPLRAGHPHAPRPGTSTGPPGRP